MQQSVHWGSIYSKNPGRRKLLEDILPEGLSYQVEEFFPLSESHHFCESKFKAIFYPNICSIEDTDKFFDQFRDLTNTDYNKTKRKDNYNLKEVQYSGTRKCVQNVLKYVNEDGEPLADKEKGKNTECPSYIKFKLAKVDDHEHDKTCQKFALKIELNYDHNHDILSGHSFKFHSVRPSTKANLIELFKQGGTPSSIHDEYLRLMESKHKDDFVKVSADRSICPDYKYVFNLYKIWKDKAFGKINTPEAFRKAEQKICEFNEKSGETVAKIKQLNDKGDYCVVVCDKFCRRVHRLVPGAGDIVFVDATSGFDRQDSKLVRLMVPSSLGGLPVGWMILSSESEAVYQAGFMTLKEVLPEGAFFGRGDTGPQVFMTDDCSAEKNALR